MREHLQEEVQVLASFVNDHLGHERLMALIQAMQEDLNHDEVTATVLGEFKKGKSTLINAMIRRDLLPADVLPATAVMHKIKHGDSKRLYAVSEHGTDEHQLHGDVLKNFTYKGDVETPLNYLQFETDLSHLHERLKVIDTPGVGDLHEHRFDVTYESIPQADVVIFTLDLTAPIRKTELDYLRESILPMLTGELMFVGNFSDRLDEEEYDEVLTYMERKLQKELERNVTIVPVSALDALEDPETEEWVTFEEAFKAAIEHGAREERKQEMFTRRLDLLTEAVDEEVKRVLALKGMADGELEEVLTSLTELRNKKQETMERLRKKTGIFIKDLQQKQRRRTDDFVMEQRDMILDEIELKLPDKVENYFQKHLPKRIEKQTAKWIAKEDERLHRTFGEIEKQMAKEFEADLQEYVTKRHMLQTVGNDSEVDFLVDPGKHGYSALWKAGASSGAVGLGAGAAGSALFATGMILLIPAMTIGSPIFHHYFKESQNKKIREQVRPQLNKRFEELHQSLDASFDNQIDAVLRQTERDLTEAYEVFVQELSESLRDEIANRENQIDEDFKVSVGDWDACRHAKDAIRYSTVD